MQQISYTKAAIRALRRMPTNTAGLIRQKIEAYAMDPASQANNVKALQGRSGIRLRVGDWRVIMDDQGTVLAVLGMGPAAAFMKVDEMNEMVTIPRDEYDRLRAAAEDLADLMAYDRARAALAAGEDELIPAALANRLLNGENPLRVYRDLRGLTQAALADLAGINRVTVAEIETGRKQGSVATLRALAGALGVTLDDLAD